MKVLVLGFLCVVAVQSAHDHYNIIQRANELGAGTLVGLINHAGLTSTLTSGGPFTVLAPTDKAFAALPHDVLQKLQGDKALLQKVLKYHVISGTHYASEAQNELVVPSLVTGLNIRLNLYQGGQVGTVEGCKVVLENQNCSNGVIHVIDHVMYPLPEQSLLEYAASQPNLSQLVYSVIRANMQAELSGGPFTLFAPIDKAFDALPAGFLNDNFLNVEDSRRLLRYHVLKGTVYSSGLTSGMSAVTAMGQSLKITISNGQVMVNNAKVITADISVANGVVHLIDTFLQPVNNTSKPDGSVIG